MTTVNSVSFGNSAVAAPATKKSNAYVDGGIGVASLAVATTIPGKAVTSAFKLKFKEAGDAIRKYTLNNFQERFPGYFSKIENKYLKISAMVASGIAAVASAAGLGVLVGKGCDMIASKVFGKKQVEEVDA